MVPFVTGGTTFMEGDAGRLQGDRERDLTTLVVVVVLTVRRPLAFLSEPSTGPDTLTTGEVGLLHGETDLTTLRVILVVLVVTPVFKVFTALVLPTVGTSTTLLEMTPLTGDLTDTTRHGEGDLDLMVVFEDTAKVALLFKRPTELASEVSGHTHVPTAGTSTTLLVITPFTGDLTDTTRQGEGERQPLHGDGDLRDRAEDTLEVFTEPSPYALSMELPPDGAVIQIAGDADRVHGEGVLTTVRDTRVVLLDTRVNALP